MASDPIPAALATRRSPTTTRRGLAITVPAGPDGASAGARFNAHRERFTVNAHRERFTVNAHRERFTVNAHRERFTVNAHRERFTVNAHRERFTVNAHRERFTVNAHRERFTVNAHRERFTVNAHRERFTVNAHRERFTVNAHRERFTVNAHRERFTVNAHRERFTVNAHRERFTVNAHRERFTVNAHRERFTVNAHRERFTVNAHRERFTVNAHRERFTVNAHRERFTVNAHRERFTVNAHRERFTVNAHCERFTVNAHCERFTVNAHCERFTVNAHCERFTVNAHCERFTENVLRERPAVPLQDSTAMAGPAAALPTARPWALPPRGLAVFYGRPEAPRLFHYFLPRLLAEGKKVLCLDGANRFDPLLIARLARQRGIAPAEYNRAIRVARAFTCFQLTELLARVPRLLEKFVADALVVTALPDLYFDEDVRERDACVAFHHALDALRSLAPLPLGVAVFSDAPSFETPPRAGCGLYLEPARKKAGLYAPSPKRWLWRVGDSEPARKNMFTQLAAEAAELWRFALDAETGKLRLMEENGCSPGLQTRGSSVPRREVPAAGKDPRL